tara:strand:- start:302 stop:517 length:216 start_codon:yes stop_codon:yes gene_type:complete
MSTSYETLFDILQKGRYEYFPPYNRCLVGIAHRPQNGLAVEKLLILYYPTAMYYFVKKGNTQLVNRLENAY